MDADSYFRLILTYKMDEKREIDMAANRLVLALVFFIITLVSIAELIFKDFSWKPILLFIVSFILIAFLWKRGEK
ncbi:hypothetical protein ACUXCC_002915 [Cytobacillus horneckiae]|uniref:hypothetical protein n=1 Tax=Cytobacillus horneckiae TaxID=549687 RepID=UPI000A85DE08|nr:hypothetical protein [Cytobacillus horneckiae]NRG43932.1 hypothetical protein [Bacillus sp. CRN 9]MBN6887782.1 hypothetical protein [Cytobacillus horneckiae]MCM3179862.1 hypothetical protein [Cytobacillus horneckiae]MEC1155251.1 hypothetical protein [Cytobacillus horneckiae]MED2936696.1 hypothetical protein [Cytobacillus horneckiae]